MTFINAVLLTACLYVKRLTCFHIILAVTRPYLQFSRYTSIMNHTRLGYEIVSSPHDTHVREDNVTLSKYNVDCSELVKQSPLERLEKPTQGLERSYNTWLRIRFIYKTPGFMYVSRIVQRAVDDFTCYSIK